jgi:putative colanic acid biosynthesis acetyltransferase WcaF
MVWLMVYAVLFRPTPKPLNAWRLLLLRCFGTKITGRPFVSQSAIIKFPWLLTLEDRSALAPCAEVYNLGPVTLKARCVVSQYAYLCAGTHDFDDPVQPLIVGPIVVGEDSFLGAKALVLPGVVVGAGAIVAAGAVLTKDAPPRTVWGGNPARLIRFRDAK